MKSFLDTFLTPLRSAYTKAQGIVQPLFVNASNYTENLKDNGANLPSTLVQDYLKSQPYRQGVQESVSKMGTVLKETVKAPFRVGASLSELPQTFATGKATQKEYNLPYVGSFKSHISDAETTAENIVEGKQPLWTAATPFAEVPLDVLGTQQLISAGAKGLTKQISKTLVESGKSAEAGFAKLPIKVKEKIGKEKISKALENFQVKKSDLGLNYPILRKPKNFDIEFEKFKQLPQEGKQKIIDEIEKSFKNKTGLELYGDLKRFTGNQSWARKPWLEEWQPSGGEPIPKAEIIAGKNKLLKTIDKNSEEIYKYGRFMDEFYKDNPNWKDKSFFWNELEGGLRSLQEFIDLQRARGGFLSESVGEKYINLGNKDLVPVYDQFTDINNELGFDMRDMFSIKDIQRAIKESKESIVSEILKQTPGLPAVIPKPLAQSAQEAVFKGISKEVPSSKNLYKISVGESNPDYPVHQELKIKDFEPSEVNKFGIGSSLNNSPESRQQIAKVKEKILNREPISPALGIKHIDETGTWYEISDGHHKIQAAAELGITDFPVQIKRTITPKTGALSAEQAIAKGISKEEWIKGEHELNIKDLVLDKGMLEKINRPSLTPNEPIRVGIRLDEKNNKIIRVLDGHHRIKQAIDSGKKTIKVIFDGEYTQSQLSSLYDEAMKGVKKPIPLLPIKDESR